MAPTCNTFNNKIAITMERIMKRGKIKKVSLSVDILAEGIMDMF